MSTLKKVLYCLVLSFFTLSVNAQNLAGYQIINFLSSCSHPNGCYDGPVVGPPDDSIWVNFNDFDTVAGIFSSLYPLNANSVLLIETGFNQINGEINLLLSNGNLTSTYNATVNDWIQITDTTWNFVFRTCTSGSGLSDRYYLPLVMSTTFGLTASDTVKGIRIIFNSTPGVPDLAGVYISETEVTQTAQSGFQVLHIYPNPVSDYLNINGIKPGTRVQIYTSTGFQIKSFGPFNQNCPIDITDLEPGFYMVKINCGKVSYGLKFVKQ